MKSSIWIATSPLAEHAKILRQNLEGFNKITPKQLAYIYTYPSTASGSPANNIAFFHIRLNQVLNEDQSFKQQGVSDEDVLVIVDKEYAAILGEIIRHNQIFPPKIENISQSVGDTNMKELNEIIRKSSESSSAVSIVLGPHSSITGHVAIGQHAHAEGGITVKTPATRQHLKDPLEKLVEQVNLLIENLTDNDVKDETKQRLSAFVQKATDENASETAIKLSAKGLVDAANTVAKFSVPITESVKTILSLLGKTL